MPLSLLQGYRWKSLGVKANTQWEWIHKRTGREKQELHVDKPFVELYCGQTQKKRVAIEER